ncbi:sugar phosphate nucleotidyltransferase [Alteromonas sp. CYL-A6]|uniref:sugar phosphate nucleotidyltransferase n=1 Tax=Alteromonas nitratireducens TaxID=3390813 RepID=UPI0034B4B2A4
MVTHPASLTDAIDNTLVLILAGGQGSRLKALTRSRAKPAVEFGGHSRLIDFTLSNCINSGFNRIGVITQYQSQCLIRHLMKNWGHINHHFDGCLDILPAYSATVKEGYTGTADACFKNSDYIRNSKARYVLILSGDHIYQMDYRKLLQTHLHQQADMTVSCIEVPCPDAANKLGVVCTDAESQLIGFHEKPDIPCEIKNMPGYSLASMGIYLFTADYLLSSLKEDALDCTSAHDFGKNVIPEQLGKARVIAHRFRGKDNRITPYWRDVGTLDSYWQAHMDLFNSTSPYCPDDDNWPLWGAAANAHSTRIQHGQCQLSDVILGAGCELQSCTLTRTVMSAGCRIGQDSALDACILLPNVTIGNAVTLNQVIVDRDCVVPDDTRILSAGHARELGLTVTDNGVVLLTQHDIQRNAAFARLPRFG